MQNECADRMCTGAERMCRMNVQIECADRMCRSNVQIECALVQNGCAAGRMCRTEV